MGEQQLEQMESVPLSVDPALPPANTTTSSGNDSADQQPPTEPEPHTVLARKLMGVLAASTTLAIFLWFMAGAGFPWFIYISYAVCLINSIIYAVKTKNSFFANWTIFASTNVMLFITFLACGGGYPWFMMPLCSMAIFPVSQYIWLHYDKALRCLYIHAAIYLLINTMLFFIWVTSSLHNAYPWFIYPWCGWAVLLLIQYNKVVMHDKSRLFVYICADLGVMLMITFRFAIGPLFMVFLLLALIAVFVYYLFLKKGYTANCWCARRNKANAETATAPPQEPQQPGILSSFSLPQFHVQVNQPGFQNAPVPPPPGAMYFAAGQAPFPYQGAPVQQGPGYYAYYPASNGQLYPTMAHMMPPPQGYPVSSPVPAPGNPISSPAPSDAVLVSEGNQAEKEKEREKEEEDTHLLRNSPTRSYTGNDK
jgi:hypothetical protein